MRHSNNEYKVLVLGRNGEPVADQNVNISMLNKWNQQTFTRSL